MSGEYAAILKRRALNALKWAKRALDEEDYDTAAREAEYAVQLYIKSVIYRVSGEDVRSHNIRELLGVLAMSLMEEDFHEEAGILVDYSRRRRRELAELSEAHTKAAYGLAEYTKRVASLLIKIAEDTIGLLRLVEERVFEGEKA
ncbi:MAG: HEPN domain-containing protein [Desulfurococcales archaeon]|nr:HEPN domain-containing protein [Desulfurococcales archaeon]